MINFRIILKFLGLLLILEGICMFISVPVSWFYNEHHITALALSSLISFSTGGIVWIINRKTVKNIGKREGYLIVSLGWIIFSLFGSIPFILTKEIPSFTNAFFETISGFTTTGASILNIEDFDKISHGLLFWRSMTQWLGGMGIIVMSVATIPILSIGGMQLFATEVPGSISDKLHPRIAGTAKRLLGIYIIFTICEAILLRLGDTFGVGGMNTFESICHSLTTMATGGFSTNSASITNYSPYVHYIITIFMFLAGTNFTLSYFALHLNFKKVWANEEFKYYIGIILLFTILITSKLYIDSDIKTFSSFEKAFRESGFQVVSILTTTGFVNADYTLWAPLCIILIFMLMFFGGSSGSTGGGPKIMRILLLFKNSLLELKRLKHPNAVIPVRFNKKSVHPEIVTNILAFVIIYFLTFAISTIVMSGFGYDLKTSSGSVISCLGNIGPGLGNVGPSGNFHYITVAGKWFLSFLMLIGRLELFTVLIILTPDFWKE